MEMNSAFQYLQYFNYIWTRGERIRFFTQENNTFIQVHERRILCQCMLNNREESIKVCPSLMLPKVLNISLGIIIYSMITYIT